MWNCKKEKIEKQIGYGGMSMERDFTLIRECFTYGDWLRNKKEGEYAVGAGIYKDMKRISIPARYICIKKG